MRTEELLIMLHDKLSTEKPYVHKSYGAGGNNKKEQIHPQFQVFDYLGISKHCNLLQFRNIYGGWTMSLAPAQLFDYLFPPRERKKKAKEEKKRSQGLTAFC